MPKKQRKKIVKRGSMILEDEHQDLLDMIIAFGKNNQHNLEPAKRIGNFVITECVNCGYDFVGIATAKGEEVYLGYGVKFQCPVSMQVMWCPPSKMSWHEVARTAGKKLTFRDAIATTVVK